MDDNITYGERIRILADTLDRNDPVAYARVMTDIVDVATAGIRDALDPTTGQVRSTTGK